MINNSNILVLIEYFPSNKNKKWLFIMDINVEWKTVENTMYFECIEHQCKNNNDN